MESPNNVGNQKPFPPLEFSLHVRWKFEEVCPSPDESCLIIHAKKFISWKLSAVQADLGWAAGLGADSTEDPDAGNDRLYFEACHPGPLPCPGAPAGPRTEPPLPCSSLEGRQKCSSLRDLWPGHLIPIQQSSSPSHMGKVQPLCSVPGLP